MRLKKIKRVNVITKEETSLEGLWVSSGLNYLLLKDCVVQGKKVDGDIFIYKKNIDFIQVVG